MKFNYFARTKQGGIQSGVVEANSRNTAINALQRHGLVIISLDEIGNEPLALRNISLFKKIKIEEIVVFTRELATLFEAGVSLVESLRVLTRQTDNPYFKAKISEITSDVDAGSPLSQALARHSSVFSDYYISMVRSGESSGTLQEVLVYLADHEEKDYDLKRKIKGALVYPFIILIALAIIGVIMMFLVVPQLLLIFEESGVALPLITRIFLGLGSFVINFWWLLALSLIVLVVLWVWYINTPHGKEKWDEWKLQLPIFGVLFHHVYLARFSENLGTLIKGGIPIVEALRVTGSVVGNIVIKKIIYQASEEVKKGNTINAALERRQFMPPLVVRMVDVGEKTGKLSFILSVLSRFYTKGVDNKVSNLTSALEPFLIIVLGIVVLGVMLSVILPIYSLSSVI